MKYDILHPIESVRTAPYGFSFFAAAAAWTGYHTMEAAESYSYSPSLAAAHIGSAAVVGAFMSFQGSQLVQRQFRRKRYLENALRDSEFPEDDFSKTTEEWCMRQTARVVAEKHGKLKQYEELCESQKDTQRLRWLPHI